MISPSTHFLDLAGPDQVIHEAIYFKADFQLEYCAYSEKTYTSSGLHFAPLKSYKSVKKYIQVIISYCPGWAGHQFHSHTWSGTSFILYLAQSSI